MARILLTGGTGRLGSALRRAYPETIAPGRFDLDIEDAAGCREAIRSESPDIIIHAAGFVNAVEAEAKRHECWTANVRGTENMVRAANGRRFVYISTDYVFDGNQGEYSEYDPPNPVNFYGVTKMAGEVIVSQYPNTLILRAPFRADPPWRYPRAFDDQWTSCDFVSERAPQIIEAALSDWTGILHIGGRRRSIYNMAREVSLGVLPISRKTAAVNLPEDTSLDSSKWHSLRSQLRQSSQLVATSI